MKYSTEAFDSIHAIAFPYKDIFTTVALIRTPEGDMLLDAASYDEDISEILLPALDELGVTEKSLKYVIISHNHKDHAGGLGALLAAFPDVTVLSRSEKLASEHPASRFLCPEDGDVFLSFLRVCAIPGHTMDAVGVLDSRTGTLVSGDALQQYGIFGSGKWGSNIRFPAEHFRAVAALRALPIRAILSAHDFYPVGQFAHNEVQASAFLDACEESLGRICDHLISSMEQSDEELAKSYNAPGTLPTVGAHVFEALRKAVESGTLKR